MFDYYKMKLLYSSIIPKTNAFEDFDTMKNKKTAQQLAAATKKSSGELHNQQHFTTIYYCCFYVFMNRTYSQTKKLQFTKKKKNELSNLYLEALERREAKLKFIASQ